jgi:hypothetical protein
MRRICSSAVPCLGSNIFEVGQMERMPISISIPNFSAWATFRKPRLNVQATSRSAGPAVCRRLYYGQIGMMRIAFVLLLACQIVGAAECTPPAGVVARLRTHFRYLNGLEKNVTHDEHFSMATVRGWLFLRQDTVGTNYVPNARPVWVFDGNNGFSEIDGTHCPTDATWVDCVAYWRDHSKDPPHVTSEPPEAYRYPPTHLNVWVCKFTLQVPKWRPSPNTAEKQRIAGKIAKELLDFGYADATVIYVRDFNLDDPDITAYIKDRKGEVRLQGCRFDYTKVPCCWGWHLFGQSPQSWLRHSVMSLPYRVYPPPVGGR